MSKLILAVTMAALTACAASTTFGGDWSPLKDRSGGVAAMKRSAASDPAGIKPTRTRKASRLICIDPGHPSAYSAGGAQANGASEVQINWLVAKKLKAVLEAKGAAVMMTKSSEGEVVDNRVRALKINAAAAEHAGKAVTVHLHCDAGGGKGFALYYPDRKGTYTGVNGTEPDIGFTGPEPAVQTASKGLAAAVHTSMLQLLRGKLNDMGVKGDSKTAVGGRQGALSYSIFSKIPTVTIEMVVLTNPGDAAFIRSEAGRQKMAEAIAAGLLKY